MGGNHRIGGARVAVVVAVVVLGSLLAACATTNSASSPGPNHNASKATVAGCPAGASAMTQDELARRACAALSNLAQTTQAAQSVQTAYHAQDTSAKITVTVGGVVPLSDQQISAAQELTKAISLREEQAMWTSGVALKEVVVTVMGPTQDEYATIIAQPYGVALLDAPTATLFNWAGLSADSAWNRYDSVYLRPTFDVVDDLPAAP